jgi:hypothetical protein
VVDNDNLLSRTDFKKLQDALLVSCARFSTPEAELNIGLRERDLRLWLSQVHQDSKQVKLRRISTFSLKFY